MILMATRPLGFIVRSTPWCTDHGQANRRNSFPTFVTASMAAEKKLAGAAKTSYLKKCEKDATATCDAAAAEKKLAGAAKNSFTKKCVKDAVG
jgi:hypothetical protein